MMGHYDFANESVFGARKFFRPPSYTETPLRGRVPNMSADANPDSVKGWDVLNGEDPATFNYRWKNVYKNRLISAVVGLGTIFSSATLPLAVGGYLLANSAKADDNLEIRNVVNSGYGAGIINLQHNSGAQEFGPDGLDDLWINYSPNPIQPEMKIITKPYSSELFYDSRPSESQSKFVGELSAINRNDASAVINSPTNRIRFKFVDGGADAERNYLFKTTRFAQNSPTGQEINSYTNLASFVPFDGSTFKYFEGMPSIINATNGVPYGTFELSCTKTNGTLIGDEDTPLPLDTTNHISGVNYNFIDAPTNGVISGTAPNLRFTPPADWSGNDFIRYEIRDPANNVLAVEQREINVLPVNDAPIASGTNYTIGNKMVLNGQVYGSDVDSPSANLTFRLLSTPNSGVLNLNTNTGAFSYTPANGFTGNTEFSFDVSDGLTNSMPANVGLNVTNMNSVPVAFNSSYTNLEDMLITGSLNASDADAGDVLNYTITQQPTNGILNVNGTNWTYLSFTNSFDKDGFKFRASDGQEDSNEGTVDFTILPVNDRPLAYDFGGLNVDEDNQLNLQLRGFDVENGTNLTYQITRQPTNGVLIGEMPNIAYRPNADFNGGDGLAYRVIDSEGFESEIVEVPINVNSVNDAPVYSGPLSLETGKNLPLSFQFSGNDVDSADLTFQVLNAPTNGVLSQSDNFATYTPNNKFVGQDTFSLRVFDGQTNSPLFSVPINVTNINSKPIVLSGNYTNLEDTLLLGSLNVTDADGDTNALRVSRNPLFGQVSLNGTNFVYTSQTNWSGIDSFGVIANDGQKDSDEAEIGITTLPVDDAPYMFSTNYVMGKNGTLESRLNADDVDSTNITFRLLNAPTNGVLNLDTNTGSFVYAPTTNFLGNLNFTVEPFDGEIAGNPAQVSIEVTNINRNPYFISPFVVSTVRNGQVNTNILAGDADGDALTFSIVNSPTNGIASLEGNVLNYVPNTNFFGGDGLRIRVEDEFGGSDEKDFTLDILRVAYPPVASNLNLTLGKNRSIGFTLPVYNLDGGDLSAFIVNSPTNGNLVLNGIEGVYTPFSNKFGADIFSYKVRNSDALESADAIGEINITNINRAPVFVSPTNILTLENVPVNYSVNVTDADWDVPVLSVFRQPTNAIASLVGTNLFIEPPTNWYGKDSIVLKADDGIDFSLFEIPIDVAKLNHAPLISGDYNIERQPGQQVSLPISKLMDKITDPDGDTVNFMRVYTETPGATVQTNEEARIIYNFTNNVPGTLDSFNYVVSDGYLNATGKVNVAVSQVPNVAPNLHSMKINEQGRMELKFDGIPFRDYTIQSINDVQGTNWTNETNITADQFGQITFIDPQPATNSMKYYRTSSE